MREADRLQRQSAFPEAGAVLERARSRLGDGGPFWLYPVVEAARRDHQFLVRLEAIRLNRSTLAEGQLHHGALLRFNKARADRDYAEAFRDQGLGEPPDDPEGVAARVRASKWVAHIVAALDDWAVCAADPARQDWLLGVARRADPDPWRDRVRDPAAWRDGKALAELAQAAPLAEQPVPLLLALGERLTATGEDGVGFLRRVREQYPDDFWANFTLALALHGAGRHPGGDPAPALAYYEKALKIRPQAAAVLNDVGLVQIDKYWIWDAATTLHRLVKNDPRFAPGLNNLGVALERKGYWPLAVLTYQDALEIDPQLAAAHCNLGEIQAGSGSLDEAIDHYRQALRSDPDCARAHHLLGIALVAKGRFEEADDDYPESVKPLNQFRGPALDEAMACYKQAQDCDPAWTPARNTLRIPPQDEARLKEAIDHYRQAVRIEPYFAWCHGALGQALLARREFTEAEAEIRRGLDLVSEGEKFHANLERQLRRCRRLLALEGRHPRRRPGKGHACRRRLPRPGGTLFGPEALRHGRSPLCRGTRSHTPIDRGPPRRSPVQRRPRRRPGRRRSWRRRGRARGAGAGGIAQTGARLVATRPGRLGQKGRHRHGSGPHPGSEDVGALAGRPRPGRAPRRGHPAEIAFGRTPGLPGAVARGCSPAPPCPNDPVSIRPACSTRSMNSCRVAHHSRFHSRQPIGGATRGGDAELLILSGVSRPGTLGRPESSAVVGASQAPRRG